MRLVQKSHLLTPIVSVFSEVKLFHQTVIHEGWLALVGIVFSLGAIGVALLVHLFGFHCYLSKYIYTVLMLCGRSDNATRKR